MTRLTELFGLLAQLAEETAEGVDDEDGFEGIWERSVPAGLRDFDCWVVAVNFDADTARDYRLTEEERVELRPGWGRIWPTDDSPLPAAVVSPGGGRVIGTPDDDLEGELIRDVRAEVERVRSAETDAVGNGGDEP